MHTLPTERLSLTGLSQRHIACCPAVLILTVTALLGGWSRDAPAATRQLLQLAGKRDALPLVLTGHLSTHTHQQSVLYLIRARKIIAAHMNFSRCVGLSNIGIIVSFTQTFELLHAYFSSSDSALFIFRSHFSTISRDIH